MTLDVLASLLAALVLVTLVTAPAGWRHMGRVFVLGLGILGLHVFVIWLVGGVLR